MSFLHSQLTQRISIAPLITFRVLFGFMMAISIIRFAYHGWIQELYIEPTYYFTYLGFDWVKPLSETGMYLIFGLIFLSAIGVMLGLFYRMTSVLFFLSFTYVELIDKTNYLNHYYFVSLMAFLLIWLPANRRFSLDIKLRITTKLTEVPAICINILKMQMVIVYLFAGLSKLNHYWLAEAMPLKLWLPSKSHIPLIGGLFEHAWVAYLFSWFGALYDLTIAFFLLYPKTRLLAYITVLLFHILTAILFQIGMFPYIMIVSTLIFFSSDWHERLHARVQSIFSKPNEKVATSSNDSYMLNPSWVRYIFGAFIGIQLILPFRFLSYPGDLYWTEQGYRFSWRVMLMEKAGHTNFRVEDDSGKIEWVQNFDYLSPQQEKMMSTQPDMIVQFAHHLDEVYVDKGFINPKIFCDSKVTLNGRRSQQFIDPDVDLSLETRGLHHKEWILAFNK